MERVLETMLLKETGVWQSEYGDEGKQNRPPQKAPLGHSDYFELK